MKRIVVIIAILCTVSTVAFAEQNSKAVSANYYPLKAGSFWQYERKTEETIDGKEIKKTEVLRTEVKQVSVKGSVKAAIMNGINPEYALGQEDADEFALIVDSKKGVIITGVPELAKDYISGIAEAQKEIPWFKIPFETGKSCDPSGQFAGRSDHRYEWYCEATENIKVKAGEFKCFRLVLRTNPDHTIIWYCPNIGVVKEEFSHHGTKRDITLELQDFGQKKS